MNPPIITLSPVCTKERVEMLPSRAIGVGVGVRVAVGVAVAVVVGVAVGVALAVAVVVAVAVGVALTVDVGVTVGVGVGGGPDCAQYLPPLLSPPPQMIISLPVQTAVWSDRASGALTRLVASQLSPVGLYRAPVFRF